MQNFSNLSDVEFEELCKDIMSKKLGISMRTYARGRDGGVDIRGYKNSKTIVVQVKHYVKSSFASLLRSLKKEVEKVDSLKPDDYYICCSGELTDANINEIYNLFSNYMKTTDNILTIKEIDDFLALPENQEIVKNHYKLWLTSTSVLEYLFTKDICIDGEYLLNTIKEDSLFFVQSSAYNQALECLNNNSVLFLTGNPGVGKTVTSKMLILYFASNDYKIRYTTDGTNLSALKRALTDSKDMKEIILLDDCFGQLYFELKSTQSRELLSIIEHVNSNKNKRLILNSRVTIFKEAQNRNCELVESIEKERMKVFVLNMDEISLLEKARILYNHLYFKNNSGEYLETIKDDKNYKILLQHENYNPRVIDYATKEKNFISSHFDNYFLFIKNCLDYPEAIWKEEYENRLKREERILLVTLYSLTNTYVDYYLLKKCYEKRLERTNGIDTSIDHFSKSLGILFESMIIIVDYKGEKKVGVANPSVNDFILNYLEVNLPEKNMIISNAITVVQNKRMLKEEEFQAKMKSLFESKQILEYEFESNEQREGYITYFVAKNNIKHDEYKKILHSYLYNILDITNDKYYSSAVNIYDKSSISILDMVRILTGSNIFDFYGLKLYFEDASSIFTLLNEHQWDLEELVELIIIIEEVYPKKNIIELNEIISDAINEAMEWYCLDVPADEFDIDIAYIVNENRHYSGFEDEDEIDIDNAVEDVTKILKNHVLDEISGLLSKIPSSLELCLIGDNDLKVTIAGVEKRINDYVYSDQLYDEWKDRSSGSTDWGKIDSIFNR